MQAQPKLLLHTHKREADQQVVVETAGLRPGTDIEARAQSDIQIDMGERVNAYLKAINP